MIQNILVPLDGSPLAELALSEALTLAQLPDSQVVLLRVIPSIEDVISDGETSGVSRWVHGRVARKVLEAADRTVVLVRAGLPKGA